MISYLGANANFGSGVTSLALSAYNQPAGELIVVSANTYDNATGVTVTSVTDTAGNTYLPVLSGSGYPNTAGRNGNFWYCENCVANAANVISVNYSAATTFCSIAAWHVTDGLTASSLDTTWANHMTVNSTSAPTSAITTAQANEAIFIMAWDLQMANTASSIDNGFTLNNGGIGGNQGEVASKQVSTTQTGLVVTLTLASSSTQDILAVGFKTATPVVAAKNVVVVIFN